MVTKMDDLKPSSFLRFPPELRNQIYEYVFTPVDWEDELIPSAQSLGNIAFLFTCRQIYAEVHTMAYSLTYSITNRWHKEDLKAMQSHFASLPNSWTCPINSLELASQWRRPHQLKTGGLCFLDSVTDYARFVWDTIELFESVSTITIARSHPKSVAFIYTLRKVLHIDTAYSSPDPDQMTSKERFKWSVVEVKDDMADEHETIALHRHTPTYPKRLVRIRDVDAKGGDAKWPPWFASRWRAVSGKP